MKGKSKRIVSGFLSALTIISSIMQPVTTYAAEAEPAAYEAEYPNMEKEKIYNSFVFIVDLILKKVVKITIEIYASIKLKGIFSIFTSPSFSVVKAVQIVCKICMCKNLHKIIFVFWSNITITVRSK